MTAVEWFFRWVNDNPEATHKEYSEAFEQAKQMEKQQIIDAQMDMFHYLNDMPYGMQYLIKRDSAEQFCETYGSMGSDDKFDVLKEMFELEQQLDIPNDMRWHNKTSSQTEISDEEIEKLANDFFADYEKVGVSQWEVSAFIMGMKEYREQLKSK